MKSTSLYLQAKGIAATVLSDVSLDKVLSFKLEKIIPAALLAISIIPFLINQGIPCNDGASSGFQAVEQFREQHQP